MARRRREGGLVAPLSVGNAASVPLWGRAVGEPSTDSGLGRPLADSIKGSRIHNMKELRPSGTSIRILFVFDPERQAVLLVAGDKAGNWQGWYKENIPVAEGRYDGWLAGGYDEEI
jgi:hypothetical protein